MKLESEKLKPSPSCSSRDEFVHRFGGIYEHSPWVAETLFDRGLSSLHDSVEVLATAMAIVVEQAGNERQLELIKSHPDLAGKAAKANELTAASSLEQSSAGLDQCSEAEYDRLTELNQLYKTRFGFPFILAVRNRTRAEVIENFSLRVRNDAVAEFRTALDEVHKIARLRLQALADNPDQTRR